MSAETRRLRVRRRRSRRCLEATTSCVRVPPTRAMHITIVRCPEMLGRVAALASGTALHLSPRPSRASALLPRCRQAQLDSLYVWVQVQDAEGMLHCAPATLMLPLLSSTPHRTQQQSPSSWEGRLLHGRRPQLTSSRNRKGQGLGGVECGLSWCRRTGGACSASICRAKKHDSFTGKNKVPEQKGKSGF